MRNGNVVRSTLLFSPLFWSITDNVEYAFPRTQNSVEAWHQRWKILVGDTHVSVFKMIKKMQNE